jgi:hypothetical protein
MAVGGVVLYTLVGWYGHTSFPWLASTVAVELQRMAIRLVSVPAFGGCGRVVASARPWSGLGATLLADTVSFQAHAGGDVVQKPAPCICAVLCALRASRCMSAVCLLQRAMGPCGKVKAGTQWWGRRGVGCNLLCYGCAVLPADNSLAARRLWCLRWL